jgi:hypothetical protein
VVLQSFADLVLRYNRSAFQTSLAADDDPEISSMRSCSADTKWPSRKSLSGLELLVVEFGVALQIKLLMPIDNNPVIRKINDIYFDVFRVIIGKNSHVHILQATVTLVLVKSITSVEAIRSHSVVQEEPQLVPLNWFPLMNPG